MKIASLLPSATEIICDLGLESQLVAVSHACDRPAGVAGLPVLTRSIIGSDLPPAEIDRAVSAAVRQGTDRKSTRLNSSHRNTSRMPSSA